MSEPRTFLRYLVLVTPRTERRISHSQELIQHSRICFSKSFFFFLSFLIFEQALLLNSVPPNLLAFELRSAGPCWAARIH